MLLIICVFITSCATSRSDSSYFSTRSPAEQDLSCSDIVKNILLTEDYDSKLEKVLAEKKLITFTEKIAQIQYPKLEWINKVRDSLNKSLRNWNNNRYPAFYIWSEEEVIPVAKKYAENFEKISSTSIPLDDLDIQNTNKIINEWTHSFENYDKELTQLIDERISLQYNLTLLKKLHLTSDEARSIKITTSSNGVLKDEIIIFHKEDDNLKYRLNDFSKRIKELDGTLLSNGRIKNRIIEQADLLNKLTIVQREVESQIKNSPNTTEETLIQFNKLSALIKNNDFIPSTYGVYKIDQKIFNSELLATTKLDVIYHKIKTPLITLKKLVQDYFKNPKAGSDIEKIGIFKKLYLKISTFTPKQAVIGGGVAATLGIGFDRYFTIVNIPVKEILPSKDTKEIAPEDTAHFVQIDQTEKIEIQKSRELHKLIDDHINNLIQ